MQGHIFSDSNCSLLLSVSFLSIQAILVSVSDGNVFTYSAESQQSINKV